MAEEKLLEAVAKLSELTALAGLDEHELLRQATRIVGHLVAADDWLPEEMAQSDPLHYRQYLLYGDPLDRYSLVSFVWGPGQQTPVHDHTVWGVIGMLRGAECSQAYHLTANGLEAAGREETLAPGQTTCVSPAIGDIHRVRNAHGDRTSISIHLYGGNIGRIHRNTYNTESGQRTSFVSGYSNTRVPNLWAPSA